MDASRLLLTVVCICAGPAVVMYVIAADRLRFLAQFNLSQWRSGYYMRALPNFLQGLNNNYFKTPWPRECNALSAAFFRFRARSLLKMRPVFLRKAFLRQHIILFGLLRVLRPFLGDFFLNEQQKIVGARVLQMEDTIERDRLIAFLDEARRQRAKFYATLSADDRAILSSMIDRRIIHTLRCAHAVFQEHGFSLLPEFTQLRRWEEMTGTELVAELPALAAPRVKEARAASRPGAAQRQ